MTVRDRVRDVVERPWFHHGVIAVIVLNAVVLGMETSPNLMAEAGGLLRGADAVMLGFFVVELLLRGYAYGRRFFRDPWNIFDTAVVAVALIPASGPFAILRVLRVLRVLRLISALPPLRRVVTGLLRALPGMASIGLLLALLMYVAGVLATKLFQASDPVHFGSLPASLFTLFQVMTGDSWGEIARGLQGEHALSWVFFIVFILVSTFIALNLFIAVAVEALPSPSEERQYAHLQQGQEELLEEVRALRAEVAELRCGGGSHGGHAEEGRAGGRVSGGRRR